ncbi:hypothetical protein ACLOJK_009318, partial [Asimina triloba]
MNNCLLDKVNHIVLPIAVSENSEVLVLFSPSTADLRHCLWTMGLSSKSLRSQRHVRIPLTAKLSNGFRRRSAHKTCCAWTYQKFTSISYLNRPPKIEFAELQRNPKELQRAVSCKRSLMRKAGENEAELINDSPKEKKGTMAGAVALIVGTSIGSGILALPKRTSPAGFIPTATCIILCWGFLLIEALLLAEINVALRHYKRKGEEDERAEIISVRTMAQETLGNWGGNLVTITYIFLAYTIMVAYTSKSGEILSNLINLPASISSISFTALCSLLISVGGLRVTDWINQWLTALMIESNDVAIACPVTISLVAVLCSYLGGDLARIRRSFIIGSIVPLVALLVWDAVALGLAQSADGVDPLDSLLGVEWSGVPAMVEAFSLLAVGTSMIGTMLGFFQFFEEQLTNLTFPSLPTKSLQIYGLLCQEKWEAREGGGGLGPGKWWQSNGINFTATLMVTVPPIVIAATVPDAFSAATDIAGGYCMTVLYGVLPPAMAWALHVKSSDLADGDENKDDDDDQKAFWTLKPAVVAVVAVE